MLGKPPSRPCALFAFARALEREWGDWWCGGARSGGRRLRRWSPADRASCGFGAGPRPGQAGEVGAGLAPRDWLPLGEAESLGACRACLRPGGGPLGGDAGNSPRAHSLHLRRPRWQPDGRTEAHVFFSFYEGSPWPSLPFWDWSGCVYWSGGSADHPAPGKAFVLFRRGVSLPNRWPLEASVSPSVDWGYNFS